jgi:hypothetical protein
MMKKTPKDLLRAKWPTKEAAADAIIALIGDPDGRTKARLKRASSTQLLALHEAGQRLRKEHQSREALEQKILAIKFPKGNPNEAYQQKLRGFGVKRLLDLFAQISG